MFFVVKTSLVVFTMAVVRPYQFEPTYSNEDREQSSSSEDESSTSTARINDDTVSCCTCGKCVTMERERENICCKEITQVVAKLAEHNCITETENYENVCLNTAVLETALVAMVDFGFAPVPDPITNRYMQLHVYDGFN